MKEEAPQQRTSFPTRRLWQSLPALLYPPLQQKNKAADQRVLGRNNRLINPYRNYQPHLHCGLPPPSLAVSALKVRWHLHQQSQLYRTPPSLLLPPPLQPAGPRVGMILTSRSQLPQLLPLFQPAPAHEPPKKTNKSNRLASSRCCLAKRRFARSAAAAAACCSRASACASCSFCCCNSLASSSFFC